MVAILQGSYLLYGKYSSEASVVSSYVLKIEYRMKHGDAPSPQMPSSGIVIVSSDPNDPDLSTNHNKQTQGGLWSSLINPPRQEPPLKLLVIGDSLAAGVGIRSSNTPILPAAIARSLSKAMGGRAVYWTCVGTPGASSSLLVQDIYQLEEDYDPDLLRPARLLRELEDWQRESRNRARRRIKEAQRAALEWWESRQDEDRGDISEEQAAGVTENPVLGWLRRRRVAIQNQVKRDIEGIQKIWKSLSRQRNLDDTEENGADVNRPGLLRRHSTMDPDIVGRYDIAVVLTGLNDLKDSFLPFMMSRQRREQLSTLDEESEHKSPLERIMHALETRMDFKVPAGLLDLLNVKRRDELPAPLDYTIVRKRKEAPLVVFPALPIKPTSPCNIAPLKWFFVPTIRSMDRRKKILASLFPGLVIFVDSPSDEAIAEAEAHTGPLWETQEDSIVLLDINGGDNSSGRKANLLKRDHCHNWYTEHEKDLQTPPEENCQIFHEVHADGITVGDHRFRERKAPLGSTFVSQDGIHPSDKGYEFWGQYIAAEIIKHI